MAKAMLTVTDKDGSMRADKYLAHKFPEYSRAALAKLFLFNLIKVNGEPIEPGLNLKIGNTIEYDLGPLQEKPEVIPLPILYEDEDVLVVDKPIGIISHARGKFWQEASVASFIRDRISGMDGERGGIVHRLDRATSGVMICAKNEATLKFLQKQFSERKVEKTYIAVVEGTPKDAQAIIDAPISRDLDTPQRFKVDLNGKTAQTAYKIIKSSDKYSTLELRPKTGRTHQLRVHLSYIGFPIVGDPLYSKTEHIRLMLHAYKLKITLPNNKQTTFTAPLPAEFDKIYL